MITDEIFAQLKTVDRKLTENKFTTKYLKTSRSYLCNRRNKGTDVSNDVLLNLYGELAHRRIDLAKGPGACVLLATMRIRDGKTGHVQNDGGIHLRQ